MIALSYDDGPNEPYTRQILDVLAEYGAKATFFVIGKWVRQSPEIVREVADAGHEVGTHTETHPNLAQMDRVEAFSDARRGQQSVRWALGDDSIEPYFRCPFGARPEGPLSFNHTGWDIHGGDWAAESVEAITEPIFKYLDEHGNGIVLLHDGYYKEFGADRSKTVEATRRILERYKGEKFVTIEEYQQCLTHCA